MDFAFWPLLQFLLSQNASISGFISPKILFSSLQLKLFDIAQRWAQKHVIHKKLLDKLSVHSIDLLGIVRKNLSLSDLKKINNQES